MIAKLVAFWTGAREFRSSLTTAYDDDDLLLAYDRGREFMHRITLRRFDD